jgi:hypothetical protein
MACRSRSPAQSVRVATPSTSIGSAARQKSSEDVVDPTIGTPRVNLIEAVSDREVYAATNDGRVLVWNGAK